MQTNPRTWLALGFSILCGLCTAQAEMTTRAVIDLGGPGWNLWLDKQAAWESDELFLPPVDLAKLPVNPPTGGWEALDTNGLPVCVPGTVEEYLWDAEGGDYGGVSWWWREVTLPPEAAGRQVLLRVDSVRLRAEVFVDDTLVGYDLIGNTPFEVDLTGRLAPGVPARLAFRITDPGGNFDWIDYDAHRWGKYTLPASHGFGGMTGHLRLLVLDPLYLDDLFVRNKPTPREVDVEVTVRNVTDEVVTRDVVFRIVDAADPSSVLLEEAVKGRRFSHGLHTVTATLSVPSARIWSLESPTLYVCQVSLGDLDADSRRFGFRWFAPDGIGEDAVFRLNGRRIVLRSAISWGFWPINGIYPTPELARRQIKAAQSLGLNMLNHHRCIGRPILFDLADEMGLLQYEEPGGYTARGGDEFCRRWAREKLLRMVKRDRSHPSLVIYNMINEEDRIAPDDNRKQDMADAHRLDPSRAITYTSGWNKDGDDPFKLHMRPYDERQYTQGWWDYHNAAGPGVYRDAFYVSPTEYTRHTDNKKEIVFWGEEGAIATPPRLARIAKQLEGEPDGWDGAAYRQWHQAYVDYLESRGIRKYFGSVDDLTRSMGNIAFYYQGRMIENVRAGNVTDGYVVNGWEAEKIENHSGVVDCFRNLKGDAELLARYNSPLYVAVKLRSKVGHAPLKTVADFHLVNEVDLKGAFELHASVVDAAGNALWSKRVPVKVTGGETYGQLLLAGVDVTADCGPGRYTLKAELHQPGAEAAAAPVAIGDDEVFLVDWKSLRVSPRGAVVENGTLVRDFLKDHLGVEVPAFSASLEKLDYVVLGEFDFEPREVVPSPALVPTEGEGQGLTAEYFKGTDFHRRVMLRTDPKVDFDFSKTPPDPAVASTEYSVRWQGKLKAPESGVYRFHTLSDDGVRLWIDGKRIIDNWTTHGPTYDTSEPVTLEAGTAYDIRLEFYQAQEGAVIRLLWTRPAMLAEAEAVLADLPRRVRDEGTTAIVVRNAEPAARMLAQRGLVKFDGVMRHGKWWLGGNFFVREHPLFEGLPVNQALNWEYQDFVEYQADRFGLLLEGEEAIVGSVSDHQLRVSTAVAVVPEGKGRWVLSTLDITRTLNDPPGPADVVRKVFCNYLTFAAQQPEPAE